MEAEDEEHTEIPQDARSQLKHRIDLDYQKTRLTEYFIKNGIYSYKIVETPSNYYHLTLEQRKAIVGAHSIDILCKSIILENTVFDKTMQNEYYQQYYLTIVQYTNDFNAEKISKEMKNYINNKLNVKFSNKHFHFRLAKNDVAFNMTGFTFNAIGPFLMKCNE